MRELLCNAGVAMLTERGFSSSGIDAILKIVKVPKGSFYHYFRSKEEFGAELIDRYSMYFAHKLDRFLADPGSSPLQRVAAFCEDAEKGMRRHDFRRGCLVGNLGQEAQMLPAALSEQLRATLEDWQRRMQVCLQEAKAVGEIPASVDTQEWSQFFWVGWEGAVLRARLERRADPLRLFSRLFLASIRA